VAIDATRNVAVVTEPGSSGTNQPCNNVALVNVANNPAAGLFIGTGSGASPELAVGSNSQANPQGVASYPQAGLAVVANSGNNSVTIVDVANDTVPTTFATDPIPTGVAVDQGLGKAVVSANGASLVDVFPVATTAQTPTTIGVQHSPSGLAIDQVNHVAVVANSASDNASILALNSNTVTNTSGTINFPQGVAFDPVSDNFLITSSANNQVVVLNPYSVASSAIRVGIDPSSIAYNFETGAMVTANNLSETMSVVDFINQTARGVFSLRSSTQFAIAIHPLTNLAVVADSVDNQLLLVPLPY
jgi:DNA-binding beta-propeller fold protein YncE